MGKHISTKEAMKAAIEDMRRSGIKLDYFNKRKLILSRPPQVIVSLSN